MSFQAALLMASMLAPMLASSACSPRDDASGRPPANSPFALLYTKNCAGCHGPAGKGSAAVGLANPVYLAIADDTTIRRATANGVPGTAMPAFVRQSGGMLTGEEVNVIVRGIRAWAKPDALGAADPPPYASQAPGDPKRGEAAYAVYCSSCHGAGGRGSGRASAIVDRSYLALVSDQGLRTHLIVGRPELGAPDWRGDVPGTPMSSQDISDVVAWLAAQRQPKGGI
jgi:cytochrome c oxidase cbb3-type subunit III